MATTLFTLFFYHFSRDRLLVEIDEQLFAAAHFAKAAQPEDFHDHLSDAASLTTVWKDDRRLLFVS